MIEVNITEAQIKRAEMLYKFKTLNNSIRQGEGNLIGAIGEIVVFDYYMNKGREVEHVQDFDFDLTIDGFKIEVKTQETRFTPQDEWTCHVPNFNATQKCEFYCFVYVESTIKKAWIYGMISRSRFDEVKQFKKEGEIGKKKPFKCDTWIVLNSDLTKIS